MGAKPLRNLVSYQTEVKHHRVERTIAAIRSEYQRARAIHSPMNSAHEGYAVILKILDELWDAVKSNDLDHAKAEAIQVAAMAMAFILEVGYQEDMT